MNPEDYLKRTRAPKPGPFLRRNVLDQAERAWQEIPQPCRGIRRIAFHPLTAAALVFFAFGFALLSSEIDQRMTASLIPPPNPSSAGRGEPSRAEKIDTNHRFYQIWDEVFDGLVWNGIGIGPGRPFPEEVGRERGT